jgi:hypothetical protein
LDRLIDALETPPSASDDLRPLVGLAAELRRTLAPAASTEAMRHRVQARVLRRVRTQTPAARRRPEAKPRRPLILRPAYAIAGLALALLLTFSTSAAYAAESSLPGDALYPVKRGLEKAQLALSVTTAGDTALTASFVDRRLAEIETLTARGRWRDVDQALQAYSTSVDELVRLEALAADPAEWADVQARLSHHLEVLELVRGKAPDSAQPALLQALERAGRGRQEVEDRHGDKKPDHTPPGQEKKSTGSSGNSGD